MSETLDDIDRILVRGLVADGRATQPLDPGDDVQVRPLDGAVEERLGAQFLDHRRGLELVGGAVVIAMGVVMLMPTGWMASLRSPGISKAIFFFTTYFRGSMTLTVPPISDETHTSEPSGLNSAGHL